MFHNQGKISSVSKRASLFTTGVLVSLLFAQICYGCDDCNSRIRRAPDQAVGYGRGWISSRSEQGPSITNRWSNDEKSIDALFGKDNSDYKDVIGLSPDKVLRIGETEGATEGKDIVFGEGFDSGSGNRGIGISVHDGYIRGRGIGMAVASAVTTNCNVIYYCLAFIILLLCN